MVPVGTVAYTWGAVFFQAIPKREWIIPEASLNNMYLTPFLMTIKVKVAVTSIAVAATMKEIRELQLKPQNKVMGRTGN